MRIKPGFLLFTKMIVKKAHCLFEQSGTFKNEFIKLGVPAEDYDIQNEFDETDNVVDLFAEIEKGYDGEPSIFDNIFPEDLICAFFPCVRFSKLAILRLQGTALQYKNKTQLEKLEYSKEFHQELSYLYNLVCKLCIIADQKNLKLIIENPYDPDHYLTRYFPILPAVIDRDRTQNGDWQVKPTQYFFLNCKPQNNIIFEPLEYVENTSHLARKSEDGKSVKTMRSMIHPQYANRFIREFILD